MAKASDKPHCVYRFFDAQGVLLYVGCTLSMLSRLYSHRAVPWYGEIANVTVEHHGAREIALACEKDAIQNEAPLYNLSATGFERRGRQPDTDLTPSEVERIEQAGRDCRKRSSPSVIKSCVDIDVDSAKRSEELKIRRERQDTYRMQKAALLRSMASQKNSEGEAK